MTLRDLLWGVHDRGYVASSGSGQPAQQHLLSARSVLADYLPPIGYRIKVSGTAVNLPAIPWFAVLNPAVTTTAKSGIYLVYLYTADCARVYLTINQGVTAHLDRARSANRSGISIGALARQTLRTESTAIREGLNDASLEGLANAIDLNQDGSFAQAYEAGTIAALPYEIASLPTDDELRADLQRFLSLYDAVVEVRTTLTASDPVTFSTPAVKEQAISTDDQADFKPKNSDDYIVNIEAQTQVKTRKHEAVVKAFGNYARSLGWKPITKAVHPRDVVLRRGSEEILCEVKVVKANAQGAVREAIGQLYTYRYFYYPTSANTPPLLAVFSAPVGDAFVELLEQLGIHSIWSTGGAEWRGSSSISALGLD